MIGTIADWRAYALARGDSAPSNATDADATAALIRASDYITYHYVLRFVDGYDETAPRVEEATYEAAALELAEPNFFTTSFTPDQRKVLTEVKGIKWTVDGKAQKDSIFGWANATPTHTKIAAMLQEYMPTGQSIGMLLING